MTYHLNKKITKEGITYNSLHWWIRRNFGSANKCENPLCKGESIFFEWSLKPGKKYEKNINNFQQLCRSCHFKIDLKTFQKRKFNEGRLKAHKVRIGMKHTEETKKKISISKRKYLMNLK